MIAVFFALVIGALTALLAYVVVPLVKVIQVGRAMRVKFPFMYDRGFHWILGHLKCGPGPNEEGLMENIRIAERCPRGSIYYMGSLKPVLLLNHPETAKTLLKSYEPKDPMSTMVFKDWLGEGLPVAEGQKWVRNRRLLTPAFHFDILKAYVPIFNACTQKLMLKFENLEEGNSIEVTDSVGACTLDIILKCAFSFTEDVQSDRKSDYANSVMRINSLILDRIFKPWLYVDWTYYMTANGKKFKESIAQTHNVAKTVIVQRRAMLREKGESKFTKLRKSMDFLDLILLAKYSNGSSMPDKEILDEVETFMFAGHDTTKSAISFTLYNLARHPEIQQRAREEVQALLEGRDSREITSEDLAKMPYLTQCVKESLRLHPPVPSIGRKLAQPLDFDGHTLLPGSTVGLSIWQLHHNPAVWGEDHMTFDPARFSEENQAALDPYAFLPFSAGPRNCLGQHFAMNEIKVVVSRILAEFEFVLDETVPVSLVPLIVLSTKHGIHLKFTKLTKTDSP